MIYRNLGATGLQVSALGLGTMQWGWRLDKTTSFEVMDAFLEAGGNFLDTADIYSAWVPTLGPGSSEEIIGEWLQDRKCRRQVVLATKVRGKMSAQPNDEGLSRKHILEAVDASLRRLRTDYIDLYQTHWFDASVPIEETMEALASLVGQGKVRYVGCSNYPAWRLMQALWACDKGGWHRYVSIQPHYNLLHRREFEQELAEVCSTYGVGAVPYSPMAGGFLTGRYGRAEQPDSPRAQGNRAKYDTAKTWRILDTLHDIATVKDTWPGAVALSWLLSRPTVVAPIVGANSVAQLQSNLEALDVSLDDAELAQLTEVSDWRTAQA